MAWASAVVAIDAAGTTELRAGLAVGILGVLVAWTAVAATSLRRHPDVVARKWFAVVDLVLAMSTAAADHRVYPGAHPQTFASAWPMSAAVVDGIVRCTRAGAAAGAVIGAAAAAGTASFAAGGLAGRWTAATGTLFLLVPVGAGRCPRRPAHRSPVRDQELHLHMPGGGGAPSSRDPLAPLTRREREMLG